MPNKKEITKIIKEKIKLNVPKVEIEKELSSKYKPEEFVKILAEFPEPEVKLKYKKNAKFLVVLAYILAFLGVFHGFILGRAESTSATVRVAGALDGLIFSLAMAAVGLGMLKSFQKTSFYLVILMAVFFLIKGFTYPIAITTLIQVILGITVPILAIVLYKKLFPKKQEKTETQVVK